MVEENINQEFRLKFIGEIKSYFVKKWIKMNWYVKSSKKFVGL